MAKEDFCFTYYDGDAARDTTHMNRLERGAYHDIIISQRKFGHLTFDQIRKILGRDFTECWNAIQLIMKVDSDEKFYIEWLDNSLIKMKKHSKKQSQNVSKRYQTDTKQIPNTDLVIPLGDGNGDVDGSELKDKKEIGKTFDEHVSGLDESLAEVEMWTNQVIAENDAIFLSMSRDTNVNGDLERLARDHLKLCARYKWHEKIESQHAFRISLLGHIADELKKLKPEKGQKTVKKFTLDELNER
jgi:hypothetical protein